MSGALCCGILSTLAMNQVLLSRARGVEEKSNGGGADVDLCLHVSEPERFKTNATEPPATQQTLSENTSILKNKELLTT